LLLKELSLQVGRLSIDARFGKGFSVNKATRRILGIYMPSLQYLKVSAAIDHAAEQRLFIHSKNVPALRTLVLQHARPTIVGSLADVTDWVYDIPPSLAPLETWMAISAQLPNLRHLSLRLWRVANDITMPPVLTLELRWYWGRTIEVNDVRNLFASCTVSHLRSLSLEYTPPDIDGDGELFPFLVRIIGRHIQPTEMTPNRDNTYRN
jgi:hypothetical protein